MKKWDVAPIQKKNILLKMALDDEKKPVPCSKDELEAILGRALNAYTCKKSQSYDEAFTKKIKIIKSSWLENPAVNKKILLLEMAKNKEVKPTLRSAYEWEQYMGVALMSYVSRTNCCYDEQFKKQLYIVNPDWFKGTEKSTLKKKKKLLAMAASKKPKPRSHSTDKEEASLSWSLRNYMNKSHRSYDRDFEKKIMAAAPEWFTTVAEKIETKKKLLLKIAKNGQAKPTVSNKDDKIKKLAVTLSSYTNKSQRGYDAKFDKKIRKLRPDWFHK